MRKLLASILILLFVSGNGQNYATADNGKRVKLNNDKTWEYIEESVQNEKTSYIFIDGKKFLSGVTKCIHPASESSDHRIKIGYDINTYVTIAKDGTKTMILFWQKTVDCLTFSHYIWQGSVFLYLENGETIKLIDRGMKGHNKIKNGYISKFGSTKDLCERYAAFYLTFSECQKLKKSNLARVAYQTNNPFETGTIYLNVQKNFATIKQQLSAIGR